MTHIKTPAEIDSGVYVDLNQPRGSMLRYGHFSDGTAAIEAAYAQYQAGGDIVVAEQGQWLLPRTPQIFGRGRVIDSVFRNGFKLRGSGPLTQFVAMYGGPGTYLFEIGADRDDTFTLGDELSDCTLTRGAGVPRGASGLLVRRSYQGILRNVWIKDLYDGVRMPTDSGDPDACSQYLIDGCRIEANTHAGVDARARPGANENSQLTITRSTFRGNGNEFETSSGPASGGIIANVQQLILSGVLFAEQRNVSLYLPGGPGLTTVVDLANVAFENTGNDPTVQFDPFGNPNPNFGKTRGRHVYIMGCHGFKARSLNLYNNKRYQATAGIEVDADAAAVDGVSVDTAVVRATVENKEYTALKAKGLNLGRAPTASGMIYQEFGHPGQTKSNGWIVS